MDVVKFLLEGVGAATLGIFGIMGNIVSIKVMSSADLDMLPTFRHLLKMLAFFDATFLIFTLSLFTISSFSPDYDIYIRPRLMPYWLPVIQISLTGSVWTTMAVSVERYLTVCCSYRSNTVQHVFYTLPIVGFSLIFNIPRFFELTTVQVEHNVTLINPDTGVQEVHTIEKPEIMPTALRQNPSYSRDYVLIANSFLLAFLPIIVLIILNSLIFRTISQVTRLHNAISSNQRRDHSVAMMLIAIVVVFIICHSLRSIINTYECVEMALHGELLHWPDWIQILVHLNHFALVVNSSINILIYSCKDKKFLNVLLITLGLRNHRSSDTNDIELTRLPAETPMGVESQNHQRVVVVNADQRRQQLKNGDPGESCRLMSESKGDSNGTSI